jgi:hypothetical protein
MALIDGDTITELQRLQADLLDTPDIVAVHTQAMLRSIPFA